MAIVLFGLAAAALVAVVVLVARPRDTPPTRHVAVLSAATSDDSRIVDMTVDACRARLFMTMDDSAAAVRVEITTSGQVRHAGCTQDMPIVLPAPLGTRSLVDGSTGAPVTVQKVPADQLHAPKLRVLKR